MSLNNDDLYRKHDQLAKLKKQAYDNIYKQCVNRIKMASDTGELILLFEIPPILFGTGYPIINITGCAQYLMRKLVAANQHIKVEFIAPNIIFIDWRRPEDL